MPPVYEPVSAPEVDMPDKPVISDDMCLTPQFFQARIQLAQSLIRMIDTHKQLDQSNEIEEAKEGVVSIRSFTYNSLTETVKMSELIAEARETDVQYDIKSYLNEIELRMKQIERMLFDINREQARVLTVLNRTSSASKTLNTQLVYEMHNINTVSQILNNMK